MNYILILLALVLLVILYNNYFTNIENLENNNNSNLSNNPLFLAINNASQINILSKEVNQLQGLKKQVEVMQVQVNLLQKTMTTMINKIGNAGFGKVHRDMNNIKDPPPQISGLY